MPHLALQEQPPQGKTHTPGESAFPRGERLAQPPQGKAPGAGATTPEESAFPRGERPPRRRAPSPGENVHPGGERPPQGKTPDAGATAPEEDAFPGGEHLPQGKATTPEESAFPGGERPPLGRRPTQVQPPRRKMLSPEESAHDAARPTNPSQLCKAEPAMRNSHIITRLSVLKTGRITYH